MKMNELRQNSRSVNRSHLINGKVSRFVNLYLLNFDSGAESAVVFPAQGNALGFGIERWVRPARAEESSTLAGPKMCSDAPLGRCPGLVCYAPLARHRG